MDAIFHETGLIFLNMSRRAASGPGQSDTGFGPVLAVVVLFLLGWLVWRTNHAAITALVLGIRSPEISAIELVLKCAHALIGAFAGAFSALGAVQFSIEEHLAMLNQYHQWIDGAPREYVLFGDVAQISSYVGEYLRWFTTTVLVVAAFWLRLTNVRAGLKRTHSAQSLAEAESVNWPHTRIFTRLDLMKADVDSGPWALSMTERQFVTKWKLRNPDGNLNRDKAEAVLATQLGRLWMGYAHLRPHAKALFAVFAARINNDFAAAEQLLRQLSWGASEGKLVYPGVDEIVKKYANHQDVARAMCSHAYEAGVLLALFDLAKRAEPLPPNWFIWLKPVDRHLWYALADLGRKAFHVEAAATFAHWFAEKAVGKPLEMPVVRTAVDGLELELAKYTNDTVETEDLSAEDAERDIPPAPPAAAFQTPEDAAAKAWGKSEQGAA